MEIYTTTKNQLRKIEIVANKDVDRQKSMISKSIGFFLLMWSIIVQNLKAVQ